MVRSGILKMYAIKINKQEEDDKIMRSAFICLVKARVWRIYEPRD